MQTSYAGTKILWRTRLVSSLSLLFENPEITLPSATFPVSSLCHSSSACSPPSVASSACSPPSVASSACSPPSFASFSCSPRSFASFSCSSPCSTRFACSSFSSSFAVFASCGASASVSPPLSGAKNGRFFRARNISSGVSGGKPADPRRGEAETEGAEGVAAASNGARESTAEDALSPSKDADYQRAADALLKTLFQQVEADEWDGVEDIDYREGVLQITCRGGRTLVINKHYATKQIWYASPISGGDYFDYSANSSSGCPASWRSARSGRTLGEVLSTELRQLASK
ncbi:iron donor protein CyaY protein [Toxoplasma gondii MAS]|uniref:Iron donor protein CyaY protein n=1 Tax=Toxoplasma gondii MAS TaxID=943118 RepID=A0A086Q539_TOXGO|nr:iron donor protein CyaY protein [Toxoplasma gondii MAS]